MPLTKSQRKAGFKAGRAAATDAGWKPFTKMTKKQKTAFQTAYDKAAHKKATKPKTTKKKKTKTKKKRKK